MPPPYGKGPLRIAIEDFLNSFGFGKAISNWFSGFFDMLAKPVTDVHGKVLVETDSKKYIPHGFLESVLGTETTDPFTRLGLSIIGVIGVTIRLFSIASEPYSLNTLREVNRLSRIQRPDAITLLQIKRRFPTLSSVIDKYLPETGYTDELIEGADKLIDQYLAALQYEQLRLRGKLSDEDTHAKLKKLGFQDDDISGLDELANIIPPIQDLTHFADRWAWDDAKAAHFRYDEEYPTIIQQAAAKIGLTEEWFKRYWRSHWETPGIQQVFEMYHRLRPGISDITFTDDDLKEYLQITPISPYWFDKLTAIAYQPLTRIDIRRFYKAGVLTTDQVYQAYLDIGYNPANAKLNTDFTTLDSSADKQSLTQAAVVNAYKRGILTRDQAKQHMIDIKIKPDDAEFFLSIADYDLQAQKTDAELQVIQAKYVNGIIDEVGLTQALGPLNLPSERVTEITDLWNVQRNNKTNVPGRAELDDLLRRNIIDQATYTSTLKRDGYEATTIQWFVQRIAQIMQDDAKNELSTQQTEQERLRLAGLKTGYQVDHQNIVVTIAQYKSAIADLQYGITQEKDPTLQEQYKQSILQYKNEIVHLNEQAANLKLELVTNIAKPTAQTPTTGG